MKKICILLLAIILLVGIMPANAGMARYGTRVSDAIETTTALVLPAGTWVYGIKIYADATNSFMGVYDSATEGGCTNATVIGEVGEATQYDSATEMFPKPIYCANGVSVIMSTGVGFIFYGPQP